MGFTRFSTFLNGVIGHGEMLGLDLVEEIGELMPTSVPEVQAQPGSSGMFLIGMYVLVFAGLYFLMIRPQKKREKAAREMQAEIKAGDNVITSSGLFGKVASVGGDCFLIEFGSNKGVIIPVRKTDVVGIRSPKLSITQEPVEETKKEKNSKK